MRALRTIQHLAVLLLGIIATKAKQIPLQSLSQLGKPVVPGPILDDNFEGWLHRLGAQWGLNGVAVAITHRFKDGHGKWGAWDAEMKGYGVADRWGTPVTETTMFSIGSNTKLFTALGLGILVEDDAYDIHWNTPIKDILHDEWILEDPITERYATLLDILSHLSGLPTHDLSYSKSDTLQTLVSKLRYLRPSSEFRRTYQYNNQMYSAAGYLIEQLTNRTYTSFIKEQIIMPLGLQDTTFDMNNAIKPGRLADGFVQAPFLNEDGQTNHCVTWKPIPYYDSLAGHSVIDPAAGLISTVEDMVRWLKMLLLFGRHPDTNSSIIPQAAILRAAQGVSIEPGPTLYEIPESSSWVYGLGQRQLSYQGHIIVEHSGGVLGFTSSISRAPNDNIGVAVLTNTDSSPLAQLIKWKIYEKMLGLKEVDWTTYYERLMEKQSSLNHSPSFPPPLPTLETNKLAGLYFSLAYGSLDLCSFDNPREEHCKSVVSNILSTLLGPQLSLVASWEKVWSTHILLTHLNGDRYKVRAINIFPPPKPYSPHPNENKPFAVDFNEVNAFAEFGYRAMPDGSLKVDHVAMYGIWGGVNMPDVEQNDGAEVWFDRVL